MCIITSALFVSCEKDDSEGLSKTTVFPIITLAGDDPAFVQVGTPYSDPGAVATVGGEEIDLETRFVGRYRGGITAELDTNISDIYNLEYTAVNSDGFSATATRQVIVAKTGDLVNSIEGLYTSTVFRNGAQGAPASNYTNIKYILIWKNNDGTYGISDTFGGWYLFGRAIANSETPGGVIVADNIATNSFSFPGTQSNAYFGGASEITNLTVNPADKTLVMTTTWDAAPGYTFVSTLTQVQF